MPTSVGSRQRRSSSRSESRPAPSSENDNDDEVEEDPPIAEIYSNNSSNTNRKSQRGQSKNRNSSANAQTESRSSDTDQTESEADNATAAVAGTVAASRKRRNASTTATSTTQRSTSTSRTAATAAEPSSRPTRATRFTGSMKEPPSESVRDLFLAAGTKERIQKPDPDDYLEDNDSDSDSDSNDDEIEDDTGGSTRRLRRQRSQGSNKDKKQPPQNKQRQRRQSRQPPPRKKHKTHADDSAAESDYDSDPSNTPDDSYDDEGDVKAAPPKRNTGHHHHHHHNTNNYDDEEEEDDLKIQRILASRTETKQTWRQIGKAMNSTQVTDGSRWFQSDNDGDDDDNKNNNANDTTNDNTDTAPSASSSTDSLLEERFLVKWADTSYLHVSWETQADLIDQVPGAKKSIKTFFKKAVNGVLLSQDDRKDGDYFDPGYCQIARILQISPQPNASNSNSSTLPTTWEQEMETTLETFDIIMDPKHPNYSQGTGRQFLVKWETLNFSESSWEYERDLILADVDYKPALQDYYVRSHKPTKTQMKSQAREAEHAMRKAYKLFGDKTAHDTPAYAAERQEKVTEYQQQLQQHVFANGGQLRDYQAEGVAWFLANYVNLRSCIMADEMGLGKTLQTAAFIDLLVKKMHRPGPFLVVVPLSTITHWQREFMSWTGLDTIVYHGSAEDRALMREHEFAYPEDRPKSKVNFNSLYLKACAAATGSTNKAAKGSNGTGQWMATVVVTTPEIMVADDCNELSAVQWEVLVVDEAHRLKNQNSKLAVTLRKDTFSFRHKLLLTGTPIQNDIKEFWTLLNFIDPQNFPDMDAFMERYGDIKSKERIDELHETIRPYILRRLKEDVEKSVPPKEETLIEVELTMLQKQYYRALYEKNVAFLHKNKRKALDGPSLNNLAMQLRKCCNHLFLLNGVEVEVRKREENKDMSEAQLLVQGSGKFVLLDKLLPRLQENGHRVLIFSQFKIMLDVLEDYLHFKDMKFERIDGSITGHRRQAAIDRFQDATSENPPFIMLLSTRAGGVGINLTAADTCIIFDSDWNPQNDLQAQARCHRIGQTKNVKVYRLLSRKSYEMQMFHMSSMKMGLDQAVLKGFESGSSGEGAMTKEEVERLLRHGAYDIFNEEKAGTAEAESNAFVQQDIDTILERRSRTVIHENTGTGSTAAGGTFSKASFVAPKGQSTQSGDQPHEDVDIEDPDFWKKMVGEAQPEAESVLKPRNRRTANYSEKMYERRFRQIVQESDGGNSSGSDSDESDDSSDGGDSGETERLRWGGRGPDHWTKAQAYSVLSLLERYGYGVRHKELKTILTPDFSTFSNDKIMRMLWSMVLLSICELAKEDAKAALKRADRQAERNRTSKTNNEDGTEPAPPTTTAVETNEHAGHEKSFQKLWKAHAHWAREALNDAMVFAKFNEPRETHMFDKQDNVEGEVEEIFYSSLWDALQGRGWKEEKSSTGTVYKYENYVLTSHNAVLNEVVRIHPELAKMVIPILSRIEEIRSTASRRQGEEREHLLLQLSGSRISYVHLRRFLLQYAPLQLLGNLKHHKSLAIGRRCLMSCSYMHSVASLLETASNEEILKQKLIEAKTALPHADWTLHHDAILLLAIAKHGWIERESAFQDIVADEELNWKLPFRLPDAASSTPEEEEQERNLVLTSKRASVFLEDYAELIDAFKGFNKQLVIDSYGLQHITDGDGNTSKWVVDHEKLRRGPGMSEDEKLPKALPSRKDLTKRAKHVLQKSLPSETGHNQVSRKSGNVPAALSTHGHTVIDESNRCFTLLAEMVRGIAKGAHTKAAKQMRLLCTLAYEEAIYLKDMFAVASFDNGQAKAQDLAKIADQIELAMKSLKTNAVPGKNLLRVMVGMEPLQPKSPLDPMFPSQAYLEQQSTLNPAKRETNRKDEGALGDKAVLRSLKRAYEKSENGIPNFFAGDDDLTVGLQLTMTESLILLSFCSNGMPLSTVTTKGARGEIQSWEEARSILEIVARESFQSFQEKAEKARATLKRLEGQGEGTTRVDAAKRVVAAEWEEALAEEAVRQTTEIDVMPFAKKSIMLLEKIRRFAFSNSMNSNKGAHRFENYLGPRVIAWFSKEQALLGEEFDIIDGAGKTMSYSTTDLLSFNPDIGKTRVAAYLDKKAARHVVSQVALLCRLRSVIAKESDDSFRPLVAEAITKSKKLSDQWEKRPEWWNDDTVEHSFLLLKHLNEHGFSNVLTEGTGYIPSEEDSNEQSLRDLGLTKAAVQLKANQLVRELHAIDEAHETLRLLEERRGRGTARKQGLDSMAEYSSSKPASASKGQARQTGLRSFFTAFKPLAKASKVIDLVDGGDQSQGQPASVLETVGKRKDRNDVLRDNVPSSEKKAKKLAPLFVIGGKCHDESVTNPAPAERIQTIVNTDGVIELVTVPK